VALGIRRIVAHLPPTTPARIRIEPLQARKSIALLNKRTEMADGLAAVCHILAGGLPAT
jgi:hypothetical protein